MKKTIRVIFFLVIIINGICCKRHEDFVISPAKLPADLQMKIMKDKLQQSFSIPINNSDNLVYYIKQGNVYVSMHNQSQLFEITELHTIHRFCGLRKLILEGLSKK